MKPPIIAQNVRPRRRWLAILFALVAGLMLTIALAVVGFIRSFGLGADTAALRDSVLKSNAADWHREVELGMSPIAVHLARAALTFVHFDPGTRQALGAFRSGEVGVYRRQHPATLTERTARLEAADKVMSARGWDRVVGVRNRDEWVAIYVPRQFISPRNLKVCLVVFNREEMVVASVRGDLEPLLELARSRPEWRQWQEAEIRL